MNIEVLYHDKDMPKIAYVDGSDWIDVRVSNVNKKVAHKYDEWFYDGINEKNKKAIIPEEDGFLYDAGNFLMLNLGMSVKVPKGYECHIVPRSSTFKNWGFIQTNGIGIIDNSYSGDGDIWHIPVYCTRAGMISRYSRVAQFRVVKSMSQPEIVSVTSLGNRDRGGFGSTGV